MYEEPMKKHEFHPADQLANERTFLAWIRTAISIIAFGFVVIRFLMPDRPTVESPTKDVLHHSDNHAFFTGVSFFWIGAAISTLAYIRYRLSDKQIMNGTYQNSYLLPTLLLIAILIVCTLLVLYFLETAFHLQ